MPENDISILDDFLSATSIKEESREDFYCSRRKINSIGKIKLISIRFNPSTTFDFGLPDRDYTSTRLLKVNHYGNSQFEEIEISDNGMSDNYDIDVMLPIKSTFKIKIKIKSISKFSPNDYLD